MTTHELLAEGRDYTRREREYGSGYPRRGLVRDLCDEIVRLRAEIRMWMAQCHAETERIIGGEK